MKEKGATIRFVYGIFFAVFSVVLGALFIKQTWSIYYSASQSPYSVESISKHFHQIAPAVWLWLAALLGNIVILNLFPEVKKLPKPYRDTALALRRSKNSLLLEGEALEKVQMEGKKHQNFRLIVIIACAFVMLALATFAILILCGVVYFPIFRKGFFAKNDGLVDKLIQCTILAILALIAGCIMVELNENSREKERKVYLQAKIAMGKEAKKGLVIPPRKETKKKLEKYKMIGVWLARTVLFVCAIVALIEGVSNGGMRDMLLKAINICTQCIGLG